MDIGLPGLNGVQFLKGLSRPPLVILVTAYDHYALDAFNLGVIDYLVKPFPFERFMVAAGKALEIFAARQGQLANLNPDNALEDYLPENQLSEEAGFVLLYINHELLKVDKKRIILVEGCKDYIKIFTEDLAHPLVTRLTMKAMEEKLAGKGFLRVHRSFIISLEAIVSIRSDSVKVGKVKNLKIPISPAGKEALFQVLGVKE